MYWSEQGALNTPFLLDIYYPMQESTHADSDQMSLLKALYVNSPARAEFEQLLPVSQLSM